ncbi:MAG: hypothetical protein QGF59_28390 [Pirellulaceae bacterium]|jgi:hypothetical protein|nr:hypothetical protein [Pirellulaceae bacterium]MDP6722615.1 hypothetical protein [Pirellulaceae bacterium]
MKSFLLTVNREIGPDLAAPIPQIQQQNSGYADTKNDQRTRINSEFGIEGYGKSSPN